MVSSATIAYCFVSANKQLAKILPLAKWIGSELAMCCSFELPPLAGLGSSMPWSVYLSLCQQLLESILTALEEQHIYLSIHIWLGSDSSYTWAFHQLFQWGEGGTRERLWKANTSWFNWKACRKLTDAKHIPAEMWKVVGSSASLLNSLIAAHDLVFGVKSQCDHSV